MKPIVQNNKQELLKLDPLKLRYTLQQIETLKREYQNMRILQKEPKNNYESYKQIKNRLKKSINIVVMQMLLKIKI